MAHSLFISDTGPAAATGTAPRNTKLEDESLREQDGLKVMGYAADQVANAVKDIFYGDALTAARMLKGAGLRADEVANALETAWNFELNELIISLKTAGHSASDAGNAVTAVVELTAEQMAVALLGTGFTPKEDSELRNTPGW